MAAFNSTALTRDLYDYAIRRALSALIGYAGRLGRGWYHLASGKVIAAAEVVL